MGSPKRIVVRAVLGVALCGLVLSRPLSSAAAQVTADPPALSAAAVAALDLNLADESALIALPGIGAGRARAILAYREARGGFRHVNELLRIRGIGRKLLAKLRPHVTVATAGREGAHPVR